MDGFDVSALRREPQGARRHTDNSGGLAEVQPELLSL
jgi:hypothetical protein